MNDEPILFNTHFIRNISLIFCDKKTSADYVNDMLRHTVSSGDQKIFNCGYPKYDLISENRYTESPLWPRKRSGSIYRLLWTPRWTTDPRLGGSHFFDYKDFLIAWAEKDPSIDLLFRPHPLALDHFIATGQLTEKSMRDYLERYEKCPNANIDRTAEYNDTFWSSDCLVTDISSMIPDYLFTGKPIIYCTSPIDEKLSMPDLLECLYKVNSFEEIMDTVNRLKAGEDPKKEARVKFAKTLRPEGSSAKAILKEIKKDYYS